MYSITLAGLTPKTPKYNIGQEKKREIATLGWKSGFYISWDLQIIRSTPFHLRWKVISLILLTPKILQRTEKRGQQPEPAHKGHLLLLPRELFSFTCSRVCMKAGMLHKGCYPYKLWLWTLKNWLSMCPGQNQFCQYFPLQTVTFQAKAFHWSSYLSNLSHMLVDSTLIPCCWVTHWWVKQRKSTHC